jgi:hypothetical protein
MAYRKKLCPFGINVELVDISTESGLEVKLKFHVFVEGAPGCLTVIELYNNLNAK